jgi:hypothetical protein
MANFYSTSDIARTLGVETWRVRRLFESQALPEPGRFAGKRAIPDVMVPVIVDELRARGWLPAQEAAVQ